MTSKLPHPRFFTLAEANALLPQLTAMVQTMQGHAANLSVLQEELSRLRQTIRFNGNAAHAEATARQVRDLEGHLRAGLEQIQEWGIELRDLDRGLVDFPARRGGRVVYLCWVLGEEEIGWWHELNTGFAGRQPIDTL
jgi:hypothetical protein